jgi:glycosyltransferase involved in cell wall biosynthesis
VNRLLFLTESFHPILGGGELHIRGLTARLAARGFPCTVLTRRALPELAAEEVLDGVRVLRVPPPGGGRVGKYRMVPHALRTLVRERGTFDTIVVRGTRVLGIPGLLAARALGKRVVLQPELNGEFSGQVFTFGTGLDRGPLRWAVSLLNRPRRSLLRDADRVVAMSRAIEGECRGLGFPAERVVLIPHGVATGRFRPARSEERTALRRALGLPETAVVIVYSGRLLRGKGLETLLEAFGGVAQDAGEAHLLFLGSGEGQAISVEEELRRSALSLPGRVTFAGRRDDVDDVLRACDIFAFPSLYEALGIALLEAQASGLPAVGSRTGGIVDVIREDETGFLVPPGDPVPLRESLLGLVRNPALRARLGAGARARMEGEFSDELSLLRYGELFHELEAAAP